MKELNKKSEIYKAAANLFGKRGYDKSSLDEIARKAGVAKGTIFYHFSNKEELFSCLVEEGVNILSDEIAKISEKKIGTKNKLEQVLEYHFSFFEEHADLCLMILNQLGNFNKQWQKSLKLIQGKYLSTLSLLIEDGKKEEIISKKLDTEAIIVSLFSLLAVSSIDWAIFHPGIAQKKIIGTTRTLIFKGLFSDKKVTKSEVL